MKNIYKIHYIIFFFALFFSKAIAEPTFVQSKSLDSNFYLGLNFNNDGTKMYTLNANADAVIEYILTTPYDISTAIVNNTKDVNRGGDTQASQVVFNNDGTKMFIVNHAGRKSVDYYSLSTAFDVSTATRDDDDEYFISGQEPRANTIAFNNDGTRMFIAGAGGNNKLHRIHEYSLSTGFDLSSTVTHLNTEDLSSTHSYIDGVTFNYDGTKMYTIRGSEDDNKISQFKLTTPYDVSTRSLEGTFDTSSVSADSREVVFSNDGSKMFIIDDSNDKVHEFNLSCNWSVIDGACDDPITTSDGGKDHLAIIDSQTATAKQIAIHATTPVLNRMFWLRRHRSNDQLSNQNIRLNFSNSMMASLSEMLPVSNKTNELLDKLSDEWSFWSEGSISFGRAGDTSHSSSKKIDSKGVSFGMDKKISENKLYGYAFRYGRDEVDVGSFGTTLDTDSISLSLYGTFPHDDERFIEGILGVSKLKTDHVRKGGGNTRTGNRNGSQVFGSINYFTTYQKEKFNISPNIRIDLSYTELSKYSETGAASLVYNKQVVETGMISSGFNLSNIIDYNSLTFEPNAGLEFSLDFSPTSDATYRYISQTTEYTRGIGQDSKSIRGNIGFDLEMDNGLSLMTIYERNQSEIAHSDTLYIGFGYVPDESTEYAMKLDNNVATLNYKRNLNGFDINISSNYSLMSEIPEYGTNLELRNTF
ncbi:autotransporter domain-containing protein [Candidatus Pelagibacter sp.]|uniref:autotransporter outer membrane beta-barrel domain-containing protein n=1 Tax=Candidatus Pelagibacter sp. TaxID=2024849 RepID=UPI003F82F926